MAERPITFSAPMVRAILEGRKTQTRRPIAPPLPSSMVVFEPVGSGQWKGHDCHGGRWERRCPYGQPGDLLWVRETWAIIWTEREPHWEEGETARDVPHVIEYRADTGARYPGGWPDDAGDDPGCPRWRPSIHMPRWASRITLEVVGVRVERLMLISDADVLAEGITREETRQYGWPWRPFQLLWDSMYGATGYAWGHNPWVWVVEFRKLEV